LTLPQLQSFVTVARLGTVKQAALALGVSESAVSSAVGVLRRELGDELYVRTATGIELTPGGQRLAAAAGEILGLAEQAARSVREARGAPATLRIAATATVDDLVAAPLLEAFTRRNAGVEVSLQIARGSDFPALLADRLVDVALGPRPAHDGGVAIEAVPFLRYSLIVAAAPGHRLAGRRGISAGALAGERWAVDPSGADPSTATGAFVARAHLRPEQVRVFPSFAAAAVEVAAGRGVLVGVAHAIVAQVRRGSLVALDVRGTPVQALWHASMLGPDRRTAAAWALRRFVTTPEALHAILSQSGGVPAERFRPPVHVSLWS
jgi:LysR family transcriptional regulator, low CO2-responsive transcriptional regulator